MKVLAFSVVAVFFFFQASVAQAPPPPPPKPAPPPPIAKSTPEDTSEKSEEEFAAEIAKTAARPVDWRLREFPGFSIKASMPRDPVRQTETFYEKGLGRMRAVIYVAPGASAVYLVGKFTLPYRVTDPTILRGLYRHLATGMSEGSTAPFQHINDFDLAGNLGVEMRSVTRDVRYQSILARSFVIGRNVYLMFASPNEDEDIDDPPSEELVRLRTEEFERFFKSLVLVDEPKQATDNEPPIFASSWESGVYRSEHFRFSLVLPKGWIRITHQDVEDLQSWGQTTIREESGGRTLPLAKRRTNLAAFVSAPLGSDNLAMISLTVANKTNSFEDVKRLSAITEQMLSKIPAYKVVERPAPVRLGTLPAMRMKNEINLAGLVQEQYVHFFTLEGYLLGLTVTCMIPEDCTVALDAVAKIARDNK